MYHGRSLPQWGRRATVPLCGVSRQALDRGLPCCATKVATAHADDIAETVPQHSAGRHTR
jgi:hypothetical protein